MKRCEVITSSNHETRAEDVCLRSTGGPPRSHSNNLALITYLKPLCVLDGSHGRFHRSLLNKQSPALPLNPGPSGRERECP